MSFENDANSLSLTRSPCVGAKKLTPNRKCVPEKGERVKEGITYTGMWWHNKSIPNLESSIEHE